MPDAFEGLPIAVLRAKADGAFGGGNRAWRRFAGEVPLAEAVSADDRERVEVSIRTGLVVGAEFAVDAKLRDASGELVSRTLRFAPQSPPLDDGSTWVAVLADSAPSAHGSAALTDEVLDFRQQVTGIIGHDLRNPLNTLVMGSALLKSKVQTDGERRLVERLANASERMTRMISQLVDFTALRLGGQLEMVREPVDVATAAREVVATIEKTRSVTIPLDAPSTAMARADSLRIEQLIFNLVHNAVVHGTAPFQATVREFGQMIAFEMRDAGPALASDVLPQLFAPERKRISAKREPGSLGLGLYISRAVARAQSGDLTAESTDSGTLFRLTLPR